MELRLLTLAAVLCGALSCAGGESASERLTDALDGQGVEVRISVKAEPVGLNPILSVQRISRYVSEQIFQTLNEQDPQTFELVPLLASTPTIGEGGEGMTTYQYTLDSLARWPNGTPVMASDVIFSFKALMNPLVEAGPYRPYYDMVRDVRVDSLDARTFRVITKRPYILAAEAIGDLYVYPEYAYDPKGLLRGIALSELTNTEDVGGLIDKYPQLREFADFFNNPELSYDPSRIVGSGPYELASWEIGREVRLRRRPDYWAAKARKGDRFSAVPAFLTFVIIPDPSTTINALRDRAIDLVVDMPVDEFQQLRTDEYLSRYYDFVAVPGFRYFSILLNQDDPLLADSLTRRALAYTVNIDQIIKQLLPGLARRIVGPVLPTKPYYNQQLPEIPYDPQQARSLLARAGWKDSNGDGVVDRMVDGQRQDLSFRLLSYPTPTSEAVTLVVAEGARQVGIDIEVVKLEPRRLLADLDAGNFTASFYGLGFEPTPDDFAQVWSSTSVPPAGTNRGNFQNAEADRLIEEIATTTDSEARAILYRRFQEIVYANQPMVFLYSPYDRVVISKRFDYELSSIAPNLRFNALRPRDTTQLTL